MISFLFLEGGCHSAGAYEKVLGGPSNTFQLPVGLVPLTQSPAQVLLPGLDDMETLRESRKQMAPHRSLDSGQQGQSCFIQQLSLRAQRLDMPHSKLFQRARPGLSCAAQVHCS